MARLIVCVSLIAAAVAHTAAAVVGYCPDGSISDTNVVLNTVGEDYVAASCAINDGAVLTIDATQVPVGIGGNIITAIFSKGTAGVKSGLQVIAPGFEEAATMNPFQITVSDSQFLDDAVIRLHGSLPPNSKVIVTGNTVVTSRAIFDDISTLLFAAPIYMFGYQDPYRLYPNSGYTISHNTVKCHSPSGEFACYGIGLWATLYVREGSWLDVSHNVIEAIGSEQWWADGIDGMQDFYVEGENTRLNIDYNNVTLNMGSGIEPPLVFTDKNHNNGQGDFSVKVSISYNRFVGSPNPLYPEAVYLERFVINGNSEYTVAYNYLETHGTDCFMSLNGLVTLNDNARLYIQHNTFVSNGGTPQLNTRSGGWIFNDKSQLWVTHNLMVRNDTAFPNRPYFQFDYRFMMIGESRVYVMNNTLAARNTTRPYYIVGSTTNTYVYSADYARLKVCYNNYFGELMESDAQLNATLTYNWFHLTDPVEYCWDKTPAEFVLTGAPTRPRGGAQAVSLAVAIASLLCATVALLAL